VPAGEEAGWGWGGGIGPPAWFVNYVTTHGEPPPYDYVPPESEVYDAGEGGDGWEEGGGEWDEWSGQVAADAALEELQQGGGHNITTHMWAEQVYALLSSPPPAWKGQTQWKLLEISSHVATPPALMNIGKQRKVLQNDARFSVQRVGMTVAEGNRRSVPIWSVSLASDPGTNFHQYFVWCLVYIYIHMCVYKYCVSGAR
jgi:hypothetical protein